jgi:hypothetical protein
MASMMTWADDGGAPMSDGLYESNEGHSIGLDPEAFASEVRRFAIDARRVLTCPVSMIDEVVELHRRSWLLLHQAPGIPSSPLHRWLVAARKAIDDRLRGWALAELDSLVA